MDSDLQEPVPKYNFIEPQQYLSEERKAVVKHEYYQGEVFVMSGASFNHNKIFSNLFIELGLLLKGKKCQPYGSDLRVHVKENSLYTYPDIVLICEDPLFTDDENDTITNPTVIIEILSKSTERYDRIEKFALYRSISGLKEYILVDSRKLRVEHYLKTDDNKWLLTEFSKVTEQLSFPSIGSAISLSAIYDGISF
ncbi:MAG: Uma2 family endonuclease [Flavihumibacter sp.]|nr:Uma2 family endonuclease [Flavihumibacter sp.]